MKDVLYNKEKHKLKDIETNFFKLDNLSLQIISDITKKKYRYQLAERMNINIDNLKILTHNLNNHLNTLDPDKKYQQEEILEKVSENINNNLLRHFNYNRSALRDSEINEYIKKYLEKQSFYICPYTKKIVSMIKDDNENGVKSMFCLRTDDANYVDKQTPSYIVNLKNQPEIITYFKNNLY